MTVLLTALTAVHTVGAAVGAVGMVFAEIFYIKATRDGRVDAREREYIRTTFWALRWGMLVVLITGIALGIVEYQNPELPQSVLFAPLWFQNVLALVIIGVGWALATKHIAWWLGSAGLVTGWWMILVIDAWRTVPFSFLTLVILYVVLTFVVAGALFYIRTFLAERSAG